MFDEVCVLRFKDGAKITRFNYETGKVEPTNVGGMYVRHTYDSHEGYSTTELWRARVYNTEAGAKCNRNYKLCDIVPVVIGLKG